MNPLVWLIWVTCFPIASHFCWSTSATSTQVVMSSSGTSALADECLELGDLLGRRVLGRHPEAALAGGLEPLVHRLADRGRDRLLVELLRLPRREPALLDGGPVPPCSGASCSGYQAGSPARANAGTDTWWTRMWSGWP